MGIKIIAKHKRATYDFSIIETYEAGMVLQGTEVKSLREGKVTLAESHITVSPKKEVWVFNMKIPPYAFGNRNNHEEARKRKLLLNKKEIEQIAHRVKAEGLTVVPLKIYFKRSNVKLEIALAKGKKLHDKRQDQMKKDIQRKLQRQDYS